MMEDHDLIQFRARQKSRARALGLVLGAMAVLFFAITIVKMTNQAKHRHDGPPPVVQQ